MDEGKMADQVGSTQKIIPSVFVIPSTYGISFQLDETNQKETLGLDFLNENNGSEDKTFTRRFLRR